MKFVSIIFNLMQDAIKIAMSGFIGGRALVLILRCIQFPAGKCGVEIFASVEVPCFAVDVDFLLLLQLLNLLLLENSPEPTADGATAEPVAAPLASSLLPLALFLLFFSLHLK